MRVADKIKLAARDRKALAGLSRRGAPGVAMRAQILLLATTGAGNNEIAAALGISEKTVSLWRRRFLERGTEALSQEARTPGKKRGRPCIGHPIVRLVLQLTRQYMPDYEPYWTSREVSRIAKTSESSVRRIWRDHGIKPHLGIGVDKFRSYWPPADGNRDDPDTD
jgi:transposase